MVIRMCRQVVELECETCSIYTINVKESSEQINSESMKYLLFPPEISNNEVRLQAFLVSSKFLLLSVSVHLFLSQPIKKRRDQSRLILLKL